MFACSSYACQRQPARWTGCLQGARCTGRSARRGCDEAVYERVFGRQGCRADFGEGLRQVCVLATAAGQFYRTVGPDTDYMPILMIL